MKRLHSVCCKGKQNEPRDAQKDVVFQETHHTHEFSVEYSVKSQNMGKFCVDIHQETKCIQNYPPSLGTRSLSMYGVLWWLIVATQTRDSSHFNYDCVTLCNNSHPLFVIRTILKVRSMFSARHHQTRVLSSNSQ